MFYHQDGEILGYLKSRTDWNLELFEKQNCHLIAIIHPFKINNVDFEVQKIIIEA